MSTGLVLALVAAVGYGASDFVGGVGAKRVSAWAVAFTGQLAGAATIVAVSLLVVGTPSAADFAWAAVAGLGGAVGTGYLYRGLSSGQMGTVAPVSAVGAAVLPVLVGVGLGERPAALVWLGVLVALPGIWLVSREATRGRSTRALADGAVAGLGFGTLFVALAQVPASSGLLPLAANQLLGAGVIAAIAAGLRQPWRPTRVGTGWGIVAGGLAALGTTAFLTATHSADLAVAAVLVSLYPAVTVLLAAGLLRERIRRAQGLGLLVCGMAVGLVAAG